MKNMFLMHMQKQSGNDSVDFKVWYKCLSVSVTLLREEARYQEVYVELQSVRYDSRYVGFQ